MGNKYAKKNSFDHLQVLEIIKKLDCIEQRMYLDS